MGQDIGTHLRTSSPTRVGFGEVTPDLLVRPTLSTTTIVAVLLLGTSIVALAPLLGLRRQRRMDIPAALRVVE